MIDGIDIDEPDWTRHEAHPKNECACACGAVWKSHSKVVSCKVGSRGIVLLARDPCPACGSRTQVRRSSSPPERWTL